MSGADWVCIAIAAAAVAAALFSYFWQRRKTKKLLLNLHKMLDEAISGNFLESRYDESLLSSVETRLAHYLSASAVSARNLNAEKEKIKELIADISHQTKTPIANILLYSQLLSEQELPEEGGECVKALNAQAEKLSFLIGSLVKVSRLEAGVFSLAPSLRPVEPLLEDVMEQLSPKAAAKGVELTLEPAQGLRACFDGKWTAEALYNLADNAVKYTPSGGSVTVRAVAYDMFVRIDVIDTGIGIPKDEQEKVFGRFYRGAAVKDTEGVGIGLYLARQIAAGEGAYLKVSSRQGGGTVFSMFLPRDSAGK